MVDKINPTSQFHPYQPTDVTPQSELPTGGLKGILGSLSGLGAGNLGALGGKLKNVNMGQSVEKVRGYARSNPGMVLGGLAALAIGAGLMRRRSMM